MTNPVPRVGCGAAILRDDRLLLVQRLREPEAGCWGLPGGKVDAFEPVRAAMAREVAEELGIAVVAREVLCVVDLIQPDAGEHWVSPVFLVEAYEGEPTNLEPEKHGGVGWFPLSDLPQPLTEAARVAAAALRAR